MGRFTPVGEWSTVGNRVRQSAGSALTPVQAVGDDEIADYWTNQVVGRILDKKDTIFIVDGEPSEGKSTFTLWFELRIVRALSKALGTDLKFDLEKDICYTLSGFIQRVRDSSADRPNVLLLDEGVLVGAQARSGTSDANLIFDRVASICRIKRVTAGVLHPSVWGIASFLRNRRAHYWFHVERRGLTTPHVLKPEIDYTPPRTLPFRKAKNPWVRFRWGSLEKDPVWAPYEANKLAMVNRTLEVSALEAAQIESKSRLKEERAQKRGEHTFVGTTDVPGETPQERHRREMRIRMRVRRGETLEQAQEGSLRTRASARA